jgi:two-component system, response regulator / RNA-binding antiterminator
MLQTSIPHVVFCMTSTPKRLRIMLVRVLTGSDLAAEVERLSPDLIIVDIESPDRDTLEHMRAISREHPRPVVMFTNDDNAATIRSAVRAGVSAYVVDGLSASRVLPVLEVAIARFEEFQAMRDELEQTRSSLIERKLVEKAKRKMAMDRNIKIIDLAKTLIAAAELLESPPKRKR